MPKIFDGHNDSFTRHYPPRHLRRRPLKPYSFLEREEVYSHLDLPRALEADFKGGLFAIFIDPLLAEETEPAPSGPRARSQAKFPPLDPPIDGELALRATLEVLGYVFRAERASAGKMRIVTNSRQLEEAWRSPALTVVLHLEGCEALDGDLNSLETLYRAGVRSLGPCWSRPNIFGVGVPFAYPASPDQGPGLTEAGRRLVARCGELGILLDCAHLNAQGFYDIAALSPKPLVSSHTSAHTLSPSARGLDEKQLEKIAASGGLVGVTFNVPDLIGPLGQDAATIPYPQELYAASPKGLAKLVKEKRPHRPLSELEALLSHIIYLGKRLGFEHVALGSDFDGCLIPDQIAGVQEIQKVPQALAQIGLSQGEIEQICHRNWRRVLQTTWGPAF